MAILKIALHLYNSARIDGITLSVHHYNVLLYLCALSASESGSVSSSIEGLEKGFEIFRQMGVDKVDPNEATFTSMARLAVAKKDPEMALI
ncbi:Proteinaceous RNase P 1 chloroplastic/mitochondrial [Bienertia sinuspersici]